MEAKDAKRAAAPSQDQIQARADAARNLQIAQAMMQKGNLSGAQSRLAAVLSTQPKNHDALSLRADLNTREQQRDASLDVARACAYMSHWTCAWHNAGNAMVIDSSNAEARSLVAQAMHESQVENTPPAPPTPAIEAPHEPPPHH
jgi:predicted Zn-dependent protease